MDRYDIYAAINAERDYQDAKWGGPEHDRQHHSSEWVDFIEKYLLRAKENLDVRKNIVRIAALAVAALEHAPDLQEDGND